VSAFSRNAEAAAEFAAFCLTDAAQRDIIARHHGQPALKSACEDAAVHAVFNGYFSAVRRSMDLAWIRPRRPGYIRFQAAAGLALERHFRGETDKRTAMAGIADCAERFGTATPRPQHRAKGSATLEVENRR
jgi:multiple sugar transport system substrate-binding protein